MIKPTIERGHVTEEFWDPSTGPVLSERKHEYFEYIENHRKTVEDIFEALKPKLAGPTWADDFNYFTLQGDIAAHDMSKYITCIFTGYAAHYYPEEGTEPSSQEDFLRWWHMHILAENHHWEHWVVMQGLEPTPLPMSRPAVLHMLIDWAAMSDTYGFDPTPTQYYQENKDTMVLHERTIQYIEEYLPLFEGLRLAQ